MLLKGSIFSNNVFHHFIPEIYWDFFQGFPGGIRPDQFQSSRVQHSGAQLPRLPPHWLGTAPGAAAHLPPANFAPESLGAAAEPVVTGLTQCDVYAKGRVSRDEAVHIMKAAKMPVKAELIEAYLALIERDDGAVLVENVVGDLDWIRNPGGAIQDIPQKLFKVFNCAQFWMKQKKNFKKTFFFCIKKEYFPDLKFLLRKKFVTWKMASHSMISLIFQYVSTSEIFFKYQIVSVLLIFHNYHFQSVIVSCNEIGYSKNQLPVFAKMSAHQKQWFFKGGST